MADVRSNLSSEQEEQLHEVADLLLQVYETLAQMRYIDPAGIIKGPHDVTTMRAIYDKYDLDPAIVYLYSILPYIDEKEADDQDFFHGGTFFNFRAERDIEQSRDPFYMSPEGDFDAEHGEYMRPWVTPLSLMGNHGTVVIYDARLHRIWAIDQEGWGTTDPALCHERTLQGTAHEREKSDWGDDSSSGEYEDDVGSEASGGSSEFWDDDHSAVDEVQQLEEEQSQEVDIDEGFEILDEDERREAEGNARSVNDNDFYHIKNRPANDFLRDMNTWYRELKEVPGQGEYSGSEWREPEDLRRLYAQHGWPDNFDGEGFDIGLARAYGARRAKYFAEDPLRQVDCYAGWLKYDDRDIERALQQVADAKDGDDQWTAQFELWKVQQRKERNLEELKDRKEKAELRYPGGKAQREEDLPLWEMEMLRVETQWKHEALGRGESDTSSADHRHRQKQASTYTKAYEAAIADAERLRPGKTFAEATGTQSLGRQDTKTGIESTKYWIEFSKNECKKLRDWATQLPDTATRAREVVQKEIEENERCLERSEKDLARQEKWLAEHGNTD
ncbi:hypothetical protein Slin15195_G067090 [Septoria linicola]|uniref:Uncharacterized protein n=1 Tax=Septoria linicola TaxID=215465 RepID=A0A9Q9AQS2_9PEZI|nr:hypothetical protein Slin14017_G099800 [Septoria linicola]USW53390.1 hypothetical protein Slin15195_G067090 [Septoria linicola]